MSLFEHFRLEERPFVERSLEWLEQVEQLHRVRRTDFLDPRQVFILHSLLSKFPGVALSKSGGFPQAERVRAVLHQDYAEPVEEEFSIACFELTSPSPGMKKLKHKDVLGSLLGLGLKRDKFGDILLHDERIQIIVAKEISDYMRMHLNQVHRVPVVLEEISCGQLIPLPQQYKEMSITVPSSRVDAVAGDVFHLSRSKVLSPIKAGHLKVNWMVVDSPSFQIREGDMISLRGFGRFKVMKDEGFTRKGNIRLYIGLIQ